MQFPRLSLPALAWLAALLPFITIHVSYLLAASQGHVEWCVSEAMKAYALFGSEDLLQFQVLDDYNRFSPESQVVVFETLRAIDAAK